MMSFWDRIGLPPRLVSLVALLFLVGGPMIALGSGTANNPNSPNAATDQGPGPTGNEGFPFAVVNATGTTLDVNVAAFAANPCVTQCTSPWIVGGTVTANQGSAGAAAWPVSAAQSGTWTVQQGTPPWSVSQSGTWTVQQGTPPWTQRIQDGVGATLATVTAANAVKVDGSAVTQPVSGTVTANQGGTWTVQQGSPPWVRSVTQVKVSATFNRPANTTAYTAKTAVSNSTTTPTVMTFSGAARVANGSGVIRSVIVTSNFNPTTTPDLVTWIFDSIPTALKDNTALAFSATDINHLVTFVDPGASTVTNTGAGAAGNISSPLLGTESGGSLYNANIPFTVTDGTTNLYGVLETFTAFTPGSGETFTITLIIEQE